MQRLAAGSCLWSHIIDPQSCCLTLLLVLGSTSGELLNFDHCLLHFIFFGYCTDMGTELGISQFKVSDLSTLLPTWFRKEPLTSDVTVEDDAVDLDHLFNVNVDVELADDEDMEGLDNWLDEPPRGLFELDVADDEGYDNWLDEPPGLFEHDVADEPEIAQGYMHKPEIAPTAEPEIAQGYMEQLRSFLVADGCNSLLPNALTIPAVLHIIHNMLLELADKLSHRKTFFGYLKLISLLFKEGRRDRFLKFCL